MYAIAWSHRVEIEAEGSLFRHNSVNARSGQRGTRALFAPFSGVRTPLSGRDNRYS